MNKSTPINIGINQISYKKGYSYFLNSLHAEMDILSTSTPESLKKCRLYVYRFNAERNTPYANMPFCAKPCPLCQDMLFRHSVSKTVYLNKYGVVEELRVKDYTRLTAPGPILTESFKRRLGKDCVGKFKPAEYLSLT